MDKEFNPPAFPHIGNVGGMTLLDWFAGKALKGVLAAGGTLDIAGDHIGQARARTAYAIAEAMLSERKRIMENQ